MPPELSELTNLTPTASIGIPIALVGAIFLALGAQFQHRGVTKVEARSGRVATSGLNPQQLLSLLARPSWVIGTLMLGLAVLFQLTALGFAPIIVVQPLGAVALVITAVLNATLSRVQLDRASVRAIALCIGGVGLFVTIAALTAKSGPVTEVQLIVILVILLAVTAAFAIAFALLRYRLRALMYIIGAGVLYGFVATLAKVVIDRVKTLILGGFRIGELEWLTVLCVVALLAAAALGGYFVQNAYSSGPPDLVIAGLTVIDPMVAVTIGVVVLQEASGAPWYAVVAFGLAGVIAISGVVQLAKHHPQSQG